jgi:hypothetical protein
MYKIREQFSSDEIITIGKVNILPKQMEKLTFEDFKYVCQKGHSYLFDFTSPIKKIINK